MEAISSTIKPRKNTEVRLFIVNSTKLINVGYVIYDSGWSDIGFKKSWMYFKNNGEIRDQYKDTMPKISQYFNVLQKSLYDYIYNQNATAKQNEW
jgi:hypothetical protein